MIYVVADTKTAVAHGHVEDAARACGAGQQLYLVQDEEHLGRVFPALAGIEITDAADEKDAPR